MKLKCIILLLQHIYQLTTAINHVISLDCPIRQCHCESASKSNRPGRVINCRDKILNKIPKITPSSEKFSELTFSTSQDINSQTCINCNNITVIRSKAFNGLNITQLNLSRNKIRFYSKTAFDGLDTVLKYLSLSGNNLIFPPYNAMENLTELRSLHLENFDQGFIDENNPFDYFPNLKTLRLINLKLNYIAGNSFKNRLKNLTSLEITNNEQLLTIPVTAINSLKSIRHLYLVKNGIRHVPYGSFKNLTNLIQLDLSKNVIQMLDYGSFVGTWNTLENLDLSANNLCEKTVNSLRDTNWTKLGHLDLSKNKFSAIPFQMFKNMSSLSVLNLESNNLKNIFKGDFSGLYNLKDLKLASNQLVSTEAGAFIDLGRLHILNIERQNEDNTVLKKMHLTRNSFIGIEGHLDQLILTETVIDPTTFWEVIQVLTNLKVLKLGKTGLNFINDFVFKDLQQLEILQVSGNNISSITQKSFHGLQQSLSHLDLSVNNIQSIDHCVLEEFENLETLYLYENPLHCDCDLKWLHKWLRKKEDFFPMTASLSCYTPEHLHEKDLYTLYDKSFICDDNYTQPVCLNFDTTITVTSDSTYISTNSDIYTPTVQTKPPHKSEQKHLWILLASFYLTILIAVLLLFIAVLISC